MGLLVRAPDTTSPATSLLTELRMENAIFCRWAMRDIRGKRTKCSPISENDLT